MKNKKPKFLFFGTPDIASKILEILKKNDYLPSLIVTSPNRKVGRKLAITPPPVKVWADANDIPTLQPEKLDTKIVEKLKSENWDLFIVATYGNIIPQAILDIPRKGTLNVHPSLLPKYRGATPIHSPILAGDEETGVSIMLLDAKMDHGPILNQEKIQLWENDINEMPKQSELENKLAQLGGKLLGETISKYLDCEITPKEQDHSKTSFCDKLKSSDALIDLKNDAEENFLKIRAFDKWPKAHYFKGGKRILIKKARLENDELIIKRILPEGGKEIDF